VSATPNPRRLACEFVVAAAACGASYYFLVDGARTRIAAVRADIAKAQQEEASRAGIDSLSDTQVSELQRTTAERAGEMRIRSLPAADEATMFGRISELAATRSVRVEQLNPVQVQSPATQALGLPPGVQAGTPAAAAAQPAPPPPGVTPVKDIRVGYSMTVTGTYSDVAAFVGGLSDKLGYTTVKSIRLSQPDLHQPTVLRAMITTEHLCMDLSNIKLPPTTNPTHQPMPLTDPAESTATVPDHPPAPASNE
jgi:hypothetical protein